MSGPCFDLVAVLVSGVGTPIRRTRFIWMLLVMVFGGCAHLAPESGRSMTPNDRQRLYSVSCWWLEGRVAATIGSEGWQAEFSWHHAPDEDLLHLSGPFGQGAVDIVVRGSWIMITDADGVTEVSERPDDLLRATLGVAVPMSALRYWVLGLSAPSDDSVTRYDPMGRLRALKQMEWDVIYERYGDQPGWVVPEKMVATKRDITLKIVVDDWRIGPAEDH